MNTAYDCIPCFVQQTLNAVRLASSDKKVHALVLREVLKELSLMDLDLCPPAMSQQIHRIVRRHAGNHDPYRFVKEKYNRFVLTLYPSLDAMVATSDNPFESAVRLAIAGNIIDFGVNTIIDQAVIEDTIAATMAEPLGGDLENLEESIFSAENILYLGDNTGEIVFDKLLINRLPIDRVTFAVRGMPIINDATMEDAVMVGMTDLVPVVDNGSDAPGTILEQCSEDFRKVFEAADLVIAKGQGNYETLSGSSKNIFFLLKAKCPVVANHIGCHVGASIITRPGY